LRFSVDNAMSNYDVVDTLRLVICTPRNLACIWGPGYIQGPASTSQTPACIWACCL